MPSRPAGWGLVGSALIGAVLGGTLVAIFMVLALIGGVLVVMGTRHESRINDSAAAPNGKRHRGWIYGVIGALLVACGIPLMIQLLKQEAPLEPAVDAVPDAVISQPITAPKSSPESLEKLSRSEITGPEANKLTELGASPPENQVAAFTRLTGTEKPTDVQRAARNQAVVDAMIKAKGTVVIWDVVVNDIKAQGQGAFVITTKCAALAGQVTPEAQVQMAQPDVDISLMTRGGDEVKAVESLSGCAVIKVKGVVAGFDAATKKMLLSPAILVVAGAYHAADVKVDRIGESKQAATASSEAETSTKIPAEAEAKDSTLAARSVDPVEASEQSSDDRLRVVDAELNRVYGELMKSLSPERQIELKQSERAWVRKKEDACKRDQKCAVQFTEDRLVELSRQ
jgi:uncharacterized protein YecT (DUF1311 family)